MIKVLLFKDGLKVELPLEEFLLEYHEKAPEGWLEEISQHVDLSLKIENEEELNQFLNTLNLKWFNYKKVKTLYNNLKNSRYNNIFDDDILRYISFLFGIGCFERMNIEIDYENPNLDSILNTKFIFHPKNEKNQISKMNMFSILDLLPLKNGMNAIRSELIKARKW